MSLFNIIITLLIIKAVKTSRFCPKECDCDLDDVGLNRAICENQNLISIEFGVPSDVEVFDLSHNAVYELESYQLKVLGFTALIHFDLSYNNLVWIGINAFDGLTQLRIVNLSHNRLRAIAPDIFWNNGALEEVDFSGNMFHIVKNKPFLTHINVMVLNLSECRIAYFPYKMFTELSNLRSLDISENYNLGLTMATLNPLKRLTKLKIESEYLKCTPELIELEHWILNQDISYNINCRDKKGKHMFEKMELLDEKPPPLPPKIDLDQVWCNRSRQNYSDKKNNTDMTFFDKFNQIPAIYALIMGSQVGLLIGIILTYIWLSYCGGKRKNERVNRVRKVARVREAQPILTPSQMRALKLWHPKSVHMFKATKS